MNTFSRASTIASLALLATLIHPSASHAQDSAARYTFSWPIEVNTPKPRGGTTKGVPVTLDQAESVAWKALQAKDLTPLERDRRAILAMSGAYRVTFDFLEAAPFAAGAKPVAPYQSWGTEKVYVDRDEPKFISLVHILEMRILQPDGKASDPMVTKHWRQDWTYEPAQIVEYQGLDRWQRRKLTTPESGGTWSQVVYQVDESPRYASIGRWQHSGSFSTWMSGDTWRPLPRREWSVRSDYQLLIGTNRHTIIPTGWFQEENNLKAVLTDQRALSATQPYLAREYGFARYERIRDADFAAADRYYERTKEFWDRVRDRWNGAFAQQGVVTLKGPVDKLGLFHPLFERADEIETQARPVNKEDDRVIGDALKAMGVGVTTMKIDAPLAARMARAGDAEQIPVIITLARREDLDAVVRKTGIKIGMAYENIPSASATVSVAKVKELAALPQVTQIELDTEAQAF